MSCVALGWMSGYVVACSCGSLSGTDPAASSAAAAAAVASATAAAATAAAVAAAASSGADLNRGLGAGFKCQLLLLPRTHLELSAIVASYTLSKVCSKRHDLLRSSLSCCDCVVVANCL